VTGKKLKYKDFSVFPRLRGAFVVKKEFQRMGPEIQKTLELNQKMEDVH